jgi:hypothetical protein
VDSLTTAQYGEFFLNQLGLRLKQNLINNNYIITLAPSIFVLGFKSIENLLIKIEFALIVNFFNTYYVCNQN